MWSHSALHGLRAFSRRPVATALVVLILALGIGFVTVALSVARSVYAGAVPYRDPDRIVVVWRKGPEPIHRREATSYLNISDWATRGAPFFDGLAAYTIASSSIQGKDGAQRVMVTYADPYFFQVLDVEMTLGRPFGEGDNRAPAGDAVVVVSHGLWSSTFGGDPALVGRTINLGGSPHTVIGVMSPRTRWLLREPLEIVAPFRRAAVGMAPDVVEDRRTPTSIAVGRLQAGVTLDQARAGMRAVSLALQTEHPGTNTGIEAEVTSFADLRTGFGRLDGVVTTLCAAAGLVFALSCLSVTLLLLARFVERQREFAVRMALGAARRTFAFEALAEGISVALVAGLVGFGLASATIALLFGGNPLGLYSFAAVTIDRGVFGATMALALVTTLLFGLVPLLRGARVGLYDALRPAAGGTRERRGVRRGLVFLQVALSVTVLAGASLVLRSLHVLAQTDYGFDTDGLLYMRILLDGPRYATDDRTRGFAGEVERRVAALPGVSSSGVWAPGLPGSSTWQVRLVPEGRETEGAMGLQTWYHQVSAGALEKVGLRLVAGRLIDATDTARALPTVVVSQAVARILWPGESALGKRIVDLTGQGWRTVVGVVSDARMRGVGRTHGELLRDCYVAFDQLPGSHVNVFLRTSGDPEAAVRSVRAAVREIDPTRGLFEVSTMETSMAEDRRGTSFIATLMALFAGTAAALTALGIYSVLAYSVSRRTREIGVRVALGAGRSRIVELVLGQTLIDIALGIGAGLTGALALGRAMSSVLYGVGSADPVALSLAAPVLLAFAAAAALGPLRRALSVAPAEALRHE